MRSWLVHRLRRRVMIYTILPAVAIAASYFWIDWQYSGVRRNPGWMQVHTSVTWYLPRMVSAIRQTKPELLDELETGDWAWNKLPTGSGEYDVGSDIWDNPFHARVKKTPSGPSIQFYSTGEDGISKSGGNDPDDINSWGQDGSEYYNPKLARIIQRRRAINTFQIFLIILGVSVACYECARRWLRYPVGSCQRCGYELAHIERNTCPECGEERR